MNSAMNSVMILHGSTKVLSNSNLRRILSSFSLFITVVFCVRFLLYTAAWSLIISGLLFAYDYGMIND